MPQLGMNLGSPSKEPYGGFVHVSLYQGSRRFRATLPPINVEPDVPGPGLDHFPFKGTPKPGRPVPFEFCSFAFLHII